MSFGGLGVAVLYCDFRLNGARRLRGAIVLSRRPVEPDPDDTGGGIEATEVVLLLGGLRLRAQFLFPLFEEFAMRKLSTFCYSSLFCYFSLLATAITAVVAFFAFGQFASAQNGQRPVLNVYTYDSFASEWGPGPRIKEKFEARCACILNYVAVDGSTGIVSRVLLEGANSRADVVLGLDNSLLVDAQKSGLLAPHNVDLAQLEWDAPFASAWDDPIFLPFDYGYFAFIYDHEKLPNPPRSFRQLANASDDLKIVIQDPRSSTSGLGLLLWVKAIYGERAARVWRDLADKILTVTQGWSEAYAMFIRGEADMVLSYTTSPAYHIIAEGEHRYRAAAFAEGHGMQIEVAAQLARAPQPRLAQEFMNFIASAEFQSTIPTGNWMYPVKTPPAGLPDAFSELHIPQKTWLLDARIIATNKSAWVDEFSEALRRGK